MQRRGTLWRGTLSVEGEAKRGNAKDASYEAGNLGAVTNLVTPLPSILSPSLRNPSIPSFYRELFLQS